jgi:hypothetical protein
MTLQLADPAVVEKVLDPQMLMRSACEETGLDDYGDLRFVDYLNRWCAALPAEARLSAMGVEILKPTIARMLVNRLRMQRDIAQHPEILDEDVSNPIVVVGFPRTGTTKLQRMMSAHPGTQALPVWQLMNPAPFPGSAPGALDPRIAAAQQDTAMMAEMFPDWVAGHPAQACDADEETFMMEMTFETVTYWRTQVPSFERWATSRPPVATYDYLKRQLQYLQWQNPGGRAPFVMKAVIHTNNLDLLLHHFPNATIVHTHRDPRVAMQSASRLLELMRWMVSAEVDLAATGADEVRYWSRATETNIAQRAQLPAGVPLIDVHYADVNADPLPVIRQIMDAHGMAITDDDEAAMLTWQRENPQHLFGRHVYSLERFGLTAKDIETTFAAYLDHFGIRPEGAA